MNVLARYLQGNTVQVYEELERMGKDAFEGNNLVDTNAVLNETMNRVAYNLGVIHAALVDENYCFKKDPVEDFEFPVLKPQLETSFYVDELQEIVSDLGHVPLSLKVFYKVVGSCNFAWDYDADATIPWEGADPIQLFPLKRRKSTRTTSHSHFQCRRTTTTKTISVEGLLIPLNSRPVLRWTAAFSMKSMKPLL